MARHRELKSSARKSHKSKSKQSARESKESTKTRKSPRVLRRIPQGAERGTLALQSEQSNGRVTAAENLPMIVCQPKPSPVTPSRTSASLNSDALSDGVKLLSQTHAQILATFAFEGVSRTVVNPESMRAGYGLDRDEFMGVLTGVLPEFVEAMKPRDALEKMALEQLMVQHARVLALSRQASVNTNVDIVKVLNEACDGASNSFRRLMTAFRDHRRPKGSGASFSQMNIAEKQVVNNLQIREVQHDENSAEQTTIVHRREAALSPQPEGFGIPAGFDSAPPPMDQVQRPPIDSRKGAGRNERVPARRAIGRNHRAPKVSAADD